MMNNRERENRELLELEAKEKKKPPRRIKVLILIFIFGLGIVAFFKFSSSSLPQFINEKNQSGILDIFSSRSLEVGDLAPDFTSEDVYGNKIALNDFRGKIPVLLVFWATWCGYCAKELPDLIAFTKEHQNEIQVIAVSSGEPKETIKDYIEKEDVNFLMVLDENRKIWNTYLVRGTPSHFLINSSGKIVSLRPGLASREDLESMSSMLTEFW